VPFAEILFGNFLMTMKDMFHFCISFKYHVGGVAGDTMAIQLKFSPFSSWHCCQPRFAEPEGEGKESLQSIDK
jgi:hypothetical protein